MSDWQLSYFTPAEMIYSHTASQYGLQNVPCENGWEALGYLATGLLEPLRKHYGKPIRLTSGYRSPEVNRLVGGKRNSQHLKGEAVDCVTENNEALLHTLRESGLEFDQAIWYRDRNFIHLSLKANGKNRKQILIK